MNSSSDKLEENALSCAMRFAQSWSLSRFSPEQQRCLLSASSQRRVPAGRVVLRRGEEANSLFIVRAGKLKASVTSAVGRDTTFDILGPNDIFGEVGLFTEGVRTADVTALEDCTLDVLLRADLLRVIAREPMISMLLLGVLAERVASLSEQLEQLASLDASSRLALSLVKLAERFGTEPAPQNLQIHLKLSQQDIADLVGLSRVFVNGRLRDWQDREILNHRTGYLTVHNLPALRQIAGILPDSSEAPNRVD